MRRNIARRPSRSALKRCACLLSALLLPAAVQAMLATQPMAPDAGQHALEARFFYELEWPAPGARHPLDLHFRQTLAGPDPSPTPAELTATDAARVAIRGWLNAVRAEAGQAKASVDRLKAGECRHWRQTVMFEANEWLGPFTGREMHRICACWLVVHLEQEVGFFPDWLLDATEFSIKGVSRRNELQIRRRQFEPIEYRSIILIS